MGDFPKPFSGNKTKKQSKDHFKKYIEEASILSSAGKPAKTRVFDFDDKLAAKEASSKKTKEMGGPNMKAPLEKALVGNQPNLNEGLKAAIEASPATMISTGMAGVDPMTGMPQANQLAPSTINPNALGSLDVASVAGQQVPGSFNRVMPQAGIAAPLQHDKKYQHTHVAEDTDEIQEDNISEYVVNMFDNDTLRPVGKKFNRNKTLDGYLMGGTYPTVKISKKNFKLKN